MNNFAARQTECDTVEHVASEAAPADVIAYVSVAPCAAPRDQRPTTDIFLMRVSPRRSARPLPTRHFMRAAPTKPFIIR